MYLKDLPYQEEIKETETTYKGNAKLKASTIAKQTGLITIADDSGLEVDFLNGGPGVYSARYALTSKDRINRLLNELGAASQRDAKFCTLLALYNPQTNNTIFKTGVVEGRITFEPIGNNGFGYDPIFYCNEIGCTFGEATQEQKSKVSSRTRAFQAMLPEIYRELKWMKG